MESVNYQGSARRTGFSPVQVSNANVAAIAREGQRTINGMKAFAEQDLKNRKAQLDAFTRNNQLESQNRETNFRLRQENRRRIQDQKRINAEIEINNLKVSGESTARIFESLAPLSKAAETIATNVIKDKIEQRQTNEYWSNVIFGVNPEEVFKDIQAQTAVEIGGEAIEIRADQAEAMGVDPVAVSRMRAANPAAGLRSKKAQVTLGARDWQDYADKAFQDPELEVSFIRDGKQVTIKAVDAVTSTERAALYPEILKRYMVERGLHKLKPTLLAPFYESVYKQYTTDIAATRALEVKEATTKRSEDAKDYLTDTKSVESFQNYYRVLKRQLGYAEGRKELLKFVYTATDGKGGMLFSRSDIEQFIGTSFDDQPNKSLADRFTSEIAQYESERRRAESSYFGEIEQSKTDQEKQWTNEAEEYIKNSWSGSQEELQALIDTANSNGNSAGARVLSNYLQFSNEAKQDEYFNNLWTEYEAVGTLTQEEVRRAPVSAKLKGEWLKKAKSAEANAISKESAKLIEDYISSSLQSRLKISSIDSVKDPTYFLALNKAKADALKAYRIAILNPGSTEQQAVDAAIGQFQREYQNEEKGLYRIDDNTGVGGPYKAQFGAFKVSAQSPQAYPLNAVRNLIRTHPDALDSQVLITNAELEKIVRQFNSGKQLTIPPSAQAIANEYGGNINAIEVINRQLKRAGLDQIPLDAYKEKMQNVSPEYQRLISYRPNTTRATIAAVGSGFGAAPAARIPNKVNTPGEILSTYLAAGGDQKDAVLMTAIAMAESSGRQSVSRSDTDVHGWFQVRYPVHVDKLRALGIGSRSQLLDPLNNTRAAIAILNSQGLGAWEAYTNGAYKKYLPAAERAMASYGQGPWRQGMNMNSRVIEYITGDRSHPRYARDHGGSNYHEHIAYATSAEALLAARKLEAAGIQVTELKGHSPVGGHSKNSYHYSGQAFDVPGSQVPVGQESELSRRVRSILGIK